MEQDSRKVADNVADEIDARLRAVADPDRAEGERRYLKSELVHLGTSVPATRKVVKAMLREDSALRGDHERVVGVVDALWGQPVHERRLAAVELLSFSTATLSVADANWLERLLRECRTWALLDPLAIGVVGPLAEADPSAWDAVLRRWASDEDFWLRRSALLAHLQGLRSGGGDWERFTELADAMLAEREFFVRKAIGWVLRETARRRPELVVDWLEPRAARAAGLTVREAIKHVPEDLRARVIAARG